MANVNWRGKFPAPRKNKYVDPTFIEEMLAYLLWWFAYDVNNAKEAGFWACHGPCEGHEMGPGSPLVRMGCGDYMAYVYAALQQYQWLTNGPPEPYTDEELKSWAEVSNLNDDKTLWLKRVAEFLPCLWD